jgi:hypothetical protein
MYSRSLRNGCAKPVFSHSTKVKMLYSEREV